MGKSHNQIICFSKYRRLAAVGIGLIMVGSFTACTPAEPAVSSSATQTGGTSVTSTPTAEPSFSAQGIRFIVSSNTGGGMDRVARQLQPAFSKALGGTNINLEYQGAAAGALSMQLLKPETDCNTMVLQANPKVVLGQLIQKADYDFERDFVTIGSLTSDYPIFIVMPDSKYQSLNQLVDEAKANPGKITLVVGSLASDGIPVFAFEEAAGVDFNVVPMGNAADTLNALLGDKAPVGEASLFNNLSNASQVRVIGVMADQNPIPDESNNAPTVNDALSIDMEPQLQKYGLFVTKACKVDHPVEYKALVDGLKAALQDADFRKTAEDLGQSDWFTFTEPEAFDQEIISGIPSLVKIVEEQNLTGES